jgi:hypothetical protein
LWITFPYQSIRGVTQILAEKKAKGDDADLAKFRLGGCSEEQKVYAVA